MTVIGQMFEEEKQEAIRKNTEEVTREVTRKVTESNSIQIAKRLLKQGVSEEKVAECTDLPLERVKALR